MRRNNTNGWNCRWDNALKVLASVKVTPENDSKFKDRLSNLSRNLNLNLAWYRSCRNWCQWNRLLDQNQHYMLSQIVILKDRFLYICGNKWFDCSSWDIKINCWLTARYIIHWQRCTFLEFLTISRSTSLSLYFTISSKLIILMLNLEKLIQHGKFYFRRKTPFTNINYHLTQPEEI